MASLLGLRKQNHDRETWPFPANRKPGVISTKFLSYDRLRGSSQGVLGKRDAADAIWSSEMSLEANLDTALTSPVAYLSRTPKRLPVNSQRRGKMAQATRRKIYFTTIQHATSYREDVCEKKKLWDYDAYLHRLERFQVKRQKTCAHFVNCMLLPPIMKIFPTENAYNDVSMLSSSKHILPTLVSTTLRRSPTTLLQYRHIWRSESR